MTEALNFRSTEGGKSYWIRFFCSEYLVLIFTVALFVGLAPFTPGLASSATLLNILSYLLPLFIVALGMTLVMITGGIDLSVTAIMAVTSVVGATLMTGQSSAAATAGGIVVMLVLGGSLGAFNGAIITLLRLPPFIITLASMMFLNGFAVWFTQSKNIYELPGPFLSIGTVFSITLGVCLFIGVTVHLVLARTVYGRWFYAVGQNPTAAGISGVPVKGLIFSAYVTSGLLAAVASIILTGRLETGSPVLGREMLLDIIGATVVGGTSLFGGKGKAAWTLFGVMFLALLDNALNLLNMSQFAITMAKGAVILFAAVLDASRQRFARRTA